MKLLSTLIVLFFTLNANSQTLRQKIESAYSRFESDQQMHYGQSSLTVMNALTGEVVFSKNGDVGLPSASTLKTVTAATAFHLLGKNFTWETSLSFNGIIDAGTLNGDVIIIGGGDPTLGSERYESTKSEVILEEWVAAIKAAGIKKIQGSVIADDRIFGTQTMPGGWTWQDMGNYYGAGPSSLTWRENQFDLIFRAGRVGEPAQLIRTEPSMTYLTIINEVKTGAAGTGDNVYAYSAPYSDIIYLRGTYGVDLNKKIAASVPDPAFDAAFQLTNVLAQAGIEVANGSTTARKMEVDKKKLSTTNSIIHKHTSPTLDKVVYWFNRKSVNLYGEHLIRTIGLKNGKEGSTAEGIKVMKAFWAKRLALDPDEMNLYDGSGLSPTNRITTSAMTEILCAIKAEPWFGDFYESLPEFNNMKMKSGTISDVIGYTGYHTASAGTPLVFSFLINNYTGSSSGIRQKMFNVLNTLK